MLPAELSEIDEELILRVCSDRCPESHTLDFKRDAPGTSDKEKHEFLKDVCAMANADGGDLAYGIGEAGGAADSITPISIELRDSLQRRLGQILDACLEPRVNGVQFQPVDVEDGFVLIIRVPASIDGPHRFIYNTNLSKFVLRNGTHTSEMTYEQLRGAFDRTATLAERAREFRQQRLAAIKMRGTSIPIVNGPMCVVHVLPIAALSGRRTIDVTALYNDVGKLMMFDWGGASRNLNLDGVIAFPSLKSGDKAFAFTQIFRHGMCETVRYAGAALQPSEKIIPSTVVSKFFRDSTKQVVAIGSFAGNCWPCSGWLGIC